MKRAWDPAVLTVLFWEGPDPAIGDVLETRTGRRYQITRFRLSRPFKENGRTRTKIKAFETVVLPKDAKIEPQQTVHGWQWGKRLKRAPGRRVFRGMDGGRAP